MAHFLLNLSRDHGTLSINLSRDHGTLSINLSRDHDTLSINLFIDHGTLSINLSRDHMAHFPLICLKTMVHFPLICLKTIAHFPLFCLETMVHFPLICLETMAPFVLISSYRPIYSDFVMITHIMIPVLSLTPSEYNTYYDFYKTSIPGKEIRYDRSLVESSDPPNFTDHCTPDFDWKQPNWERAITCTIPPWTKIKLNHHWFLAPFLPGWTNLWPH